MKSVYHRLRALLIICTYIMMISISAQVNNIDTAMLSVPGPANQDTTKFATLYITRPFNTVSANWQYGFAIEEHLVARIGNGYRYIIKCYKTGSTEIWSKTEKKSALTINIEPGRKYYVRMDVEEGGKSGYPKLVLLDEKEGESAFNKMTLYEPFVLYDPDPLEFKFLFTKIPSSYIGNPYDKTGFNEFMFRQPISVPHYFANADLGYLFNYVNKMTSKTFSEADVVQRLDNIDFDSQDDFDAS